MNHTISASHTMRKNLVASMLGIIFAATILEIFCQIYSLYLGKKWEVTKADPGHYYTESLNASLGYELASNVNIEKDNRRLMINRFGIRERENQISMRPQIAILGDSIVFGNVLSQEETISELLQQSIDRAGISFKVLNFGVPGYSLREIEEFLKVKDEIYNVEHIIYILNSNDFARRNSIYEGADAGLYRMYHQSFLKSPWFINKIIYRMVKYRNLDDSRREKASVRWYEWLFRGNKDASYSLIKEMALYANGKRSSFTVILLPVGVAYNDNGYYGLSDMFQNIGVFLEANNINYINPIDKFALNAEKYFDPTDHLTIEGNELMVKILLEHLENSGQNTSSNESLN